MSHKRARAVVLVAVASVLLAPAALADLGPDPDPLAQGANPPPSYGGLPTAAYQGLFAGQAAWSPHGTVVADSGFRPYPNGFSFTNYGVDMRVNQVLFGLCAANTTPNLHGPLNDYRSPFVIAFLKVLVGLTAAHVALEPNPAAPMHTHTRPTMARTESGIVSPVALCRSL